jgi:hypothetical protein
MKQVLSGSKWREEITRRRGLWTLNQLTTRWISVFDPHFVFRRVDHLPQDLVIHFQGLTSLFVFLVVSLVRLVVCIDSIRERERIGEE